MFCSHRPGLISINGKYECPLCFQMVDHPWAPDSVVRGKRTTQQTGIERVESEQADWPARMGVDVKGGDR